MATAQRSTPSLFNFLKEGLLHPTHNRRLFAVVFAIVAASHYLLGNDLAVQSLVTDGVRIDSKPPLSSREFLPLIQAIMDDIRNLLFTGAVDRLVSKSLGWVTQIVIFFAAVATYSGELLTFASLLGKAKTKLKGPLLTLAFVYAVEIAQIALFKAMSRLLNFLMLWEHDTLPFRGVLLVVGVLLGTFAFCIFIEYFSFVWSLSIVVAVAEPGCHGAGAVGRAWRLMKGQLLRAMLFMVVTVALDATIWPVLNDMAPGLLRRFLYTIFMAAVQVFDFCTKAAFYYDCKGHRGINDDHGVYPKTR